MMEQRLLGELMEFKRQSIENFGEIRKDLSSVKTDIKAIQISRARMLGRMSVISFVTATIVGGIVQMAIKLIH